jgi:hypothetical protein
MEVLMSESTSVILINSYFDQFKVTKRKKKNTSKLKNTFDQECSAGWILQIHSSVTTGAAAATAAATTTTIAFRIVVHTLLQKVLRHLNLVR